MVGLVPVAPPPGEPPSRRGGPVLLIGAALGDLAAVALAFERQVAVSIADSFRAGLRLFVALRPRVVVIDTSQSPQEWTGLAGAAGLSRPRCSVLILAGTPAAARLAAGPRGHRMVICPQDLRDVLDALAALLGRDGPAVRVPRYRAPVLEAIRFIAARYPGPLNAPAISRASGLSVRRLGDLFGMTGYSIMGYVARLRVEVAKSLLAGDEPLETVAERVGFSDSSHLSRVFLEVVGQRPGQYRRALVRDTPAAS